MKIVHFDADLEIKKYLKGTTYSFSLQELKKIPNKKNIEAISIKSRSIVIDKILRHFPKLKLIVTRTVGVNHVDLKTCEKRGIIVKNIQDYGASNIAEHALALLMAGARNIIAANKQVHRGKFDYKNFLGASFKGKTLGVIGTGRIGLELIRLIKNFGMKVLCFDVIKNEKVREELNFSYVSLENLLRKSDFISIHIPLLDSTFHLIGEREIRLIKQGAILVNTSRGEIINTKALAKNIDKFKAVCLDVVENERNFNKDNRLLKYDNIIITPHIGFYTDRSVKTIGQKTMEIIGDFNVLKH